MGSRLDADRILRELQFRRCSSHLEHNRGRVKVGRRFTHGRRRRVFSASLSDWLDNRVSKGWRADLCKLIEETPNLDWLLLTKRIENYRKLAPQSWQDNGPPANVWLGTTTESAEYYQRRWPILSSIPAAVRFVSYEPAVGPLGKLDVGIGTAPNWIIVGGESGPKARAMNPQWF
jgi:protein gp37